jgi:hypothetical protein
VTFRVVEVAVPVGHCSVFSNECGSGSLVFPTPSATLAVADRVLEVFPGSSLSTSQARGIRCAFAPAEGSLVAFHLSFRALAAQPELLAASEEASSSSSHGIRSLCAPLSLDRLCVHSRKPKLPSARPYQGVGILFRPRGLSPPRRLAPHRGCGFIAPRCRLWGSTRFPLQPPRAPESAPERPSPSPRRESYPSKSSPHQQPYRITTAVALLPLPSALRAWTARPKPRLDALARGRSHQLEPVPSEAETRVGTVRLRWPKPLPTRCCRWPRPLAAHSRTSEEAREPSRPSGDRGRRPNPEGLGAHLPRPESGRWRPPITEVIDGVEEPVLYPGEAPIRRGGPPRHQTGLRACRRTDRPRSRGAPTRHPEVSNRGISRASLQRAWDIELHWPRPGCSPHFRTRASGAFGAARCRTSPSAPLELSG